MLQGGRSQVRFLMRSLDFSVDPILSSRNVGSWSTQPVTEMSTKNFSPSKRYGQRARKADNHTAIYEPTVWIM
jgi:hypothetical protein